MSKNCFGAVILNPGDTPPVQSNCCPEPTRLVISDETFELSGTTIGSLSVPSGANLAEITILGTCVWRVTGANPQSTLNGSTSNIGHISQASSIWLELEDTDSLANFRLMALMATQPLYVHVTYFQITNSFDANN